MIAAISSEDCVTLTVATDNSLRLLLPSSFLSLMSSVDSFNSSSTVIIWLRSSLDFSTFFVAFWVSSAWLVAPCAMLFTAFATSSAVADVDWAVAESSSAVAAVFCA